MPRSPPDSWKPAPVSPGERFCGDWPGWSSRDGCQPSRFAVAESRRAGLLCPATYCWKAGSGFKAKLLYATLQLTPGFRGPKGQFTYSELRCLTGVSPNTLKQVVRALRDNGWLQISQGNKFSPILFALRHPAAERREGEVVEIGRRLQEASFVGEALMREYLSLILDSDEYEDNATPGFLVNPFTGEKMQFDRYYPPRVAFEFNGPQHYGPTARYSNEANAWKQQGRDYIKIGISVTRGIRLVLVHPEDLTWEVMRQKVDGIPPLRNLDGHEPVIAYLDSVSRAYRRKAQQDPLSGRTARFELENS